MNRYGYLFLGERIEIKRSWYMSFKRLELIEGDKIMIYLCDFYNAKMFLNAMGVYSTG